MKCLRFSILYFIIVAALISCVGRSQRIIGDFTFWRDGLESTGNIGYRSQGIIDTTAYVVDYWNDDNYIIARTYSYRSKPSDEIGAPHYYLIHLDGYRKNPEQLRSNAVFGPMSTDSLLVYIREKDLRIHPSFADLLE